jgi:hypothetical protein
MSMDPAGARYGCPKCRAVLVERSAEYQENLDGGPRAWVVTLECVRCNETFRAWWLMRLVPTPSGVTCEPEWLGVGGDQAPLLLDGETGS